MTVRIPMAQVPKDLFAAMMGVEATINTFGFDARLLELVRVRSSQINGCPYCIDVHYKDAIAAGETAERLYSLPAWHEATCYDDKERAALAWCDAITLIHREQPLDALFAELQKHFSETQIAHLTLVITQINSWNKLAKSFGFPAGE